jgi:tetratricopeptide (TPR) repeat protein
VRQLGSRILIVGAVLVAQAAAVVGLVAQRNLPRAGITAIQPPAVAPLTPFSPSSRPDGALSPITIDYPETGSIFPPEITAPAFLWHDAEAAATVWQIEVAFSDGAPGVSAKSRGERIRIGEIDPRCIAETNELPVLSPPEAAAKSWTPDPETWAAIKKHSWERPATVSITGFSAANPAQPVSRGQISIQTSKDPVAAPIFYRDVPLMPSELEKGVIKPLIPSAVPLISWRIRDIGESSSRLLMEGLPTCANCHSFSLDGKTLAMDVDGPQNDKGMYAIARLAPQMSIRNEDVFSWNDFPNKPAGQRTIGFMAQISPDGQYAATTLNEAMYVVNFKDYRFLQVFYPTRGIIAWYSRTTGKMSALPGADNPNYVQTDAFWSPDGKYLVFARARAKDPYPEGRKLAEYANDPSEVQIQYDLYWNPFNGGKGGRPKPIAGASHNGMSNTVPKVSPDGRWIVFVQCRNGQLMRPDGQLYIIPVEGGQARRMRCNTRLMNSWHSFSPNGRWLVFSSKGRSPYTQMFLTHLDEGGQDSPAILIENATAANRAVNIPEFVNIPQDGLLKIDVPAAEFYRLVDRAWALAEKGQYDASIAEWKKALEINPQDAKTHNNLGRALAGKGEFDEAIGHWQKALEVNPKYAEARNNLGVALIRKGEFDKAISHFQDVLRLNPAYAEVHTNLGRALLERGKLDAAITCWRKALEVNPQYAEAHNDLGTGLFRKNRLDEAITHWQRAVEINPAFAQAHYNLGRAQAQKGRLDEAIVHWQKTREINPKFAQAYFQLGDAFYLQGKIPEALAHWRSGLRLEPDHLHALKQTAWVLATCPKSEIRDGAEAVKLAEQAARLAGEKEPAILDALAAAYAEAGRFQDAVQTMHRSLALPTRQGSAALAESLKTRLALYEAGIPYRELQPLSTAKGSEGGGQDDQGRKP